MSDHSTISFMGSKRRWIIAVLLTSACLTGLVLWFGGVLPVSGDPLFRGKPESEWIKNLKYGDDQQVKEWRAYGEEGVQVLIRGLERANRPGERAYRRLNRLLPDFLQRWLPAPQARFHSGHSGVFGFTAWEPWERCQECDADHDSGGQH